MQVLIRQKDVEGAPNRRGALRVARTMTSIRFDLPTSGGWGVLWGSTPIARTLSRRPILAQRSVHVEAKEVQCGVQAWCC